MLIIYETTTCTTGNYQLCNQLCNSFFVIMANLQKMVEYQVHAVKHNEIHVHYIYVTCK